MPSSRSKNGTVTRPLLRMVKLTTTRVPGKTRTIERWRWTSSFTWLQRTNSTERKGIATIPAATMCRSGDPTNRAAIHRENPVANAAHPRLVGTVRSGRARGRARCS